MSLKNKKIVFYISSIPGLNNTLPLLKRLPNAVLMSPRSSVCRAFKRQNITNKIVVQRKIWGRYAKAHRLLKNSDLILLEGLDASELKPFNVPLAQIFHGTFRHIGLYHAKFYADYNLMLTNGPRQTNALSRYKNLFNQIRINDIGHIPFDQFITKNHTNQQLIKNKLNLALDKKTIIYLPARRNVSSWITHAVKLAQEVPENYNLIFRPHPNQARHGSTEEKNILKQVKHLFKNKPNRILDLGQLDYHELLCIADLLISDATSPAEEALFYDIPQIITESFSREQWLSTLTKQKNHPDDIENLMQLYEIGPSFAKGNYQHWADCIQDAFEQQTNYQAKRQHYFRHAFGAKQGHAVDKAITAIAQLLEKKEIKQ